MDVYIAKNDNHAATIEDFVAAMEEGNGVDLSDFRLWYRQAGTPEITVEDRYDPAARQYELTIMQRVPPTPGQPDKQPMPVPLAMGLLGPNGDEMPTRLDGEDAATDGTRVLVCDSERQVFRFADVAAPPVPSVLRNFSAPVKLQGVPLDRLKFLAIHDTDPGGALGCRAAGRDPHSCSTASRRTSKRQSKDRRLPAGMPAGCRRSRIRCHRSTPTSLRRCARPWPMPIVTRPSPPRR